jgi:hypothetical protein
MNIGQLSKELLLSGMSNQEVLSTIKTVFPDCKTTLKCIYYYSSKLGLKRNSGSKPDETELQKVLSSLKKKKVSQVSK